ncbi:MAG: hypothetical protein QNJ44_21145 [Rhodobacter sp.]|nr:hypothetical protein [Rhodobacter sp.]
MLRSILTILFLASVSASAQDGPGLSARLASDGIAQTESHLAAITSRDASQNFALGAVRFLRAIETTLQTRWRLGINAARTELPVLRLPVPPNPEPEPFRPDAIEALFTRLIDDLTAARAPLSTIADGSDVAVPIALGDLWFDINMNASRDEGEALTDVAGLALTGRPLGIADNPVIRFDTADAAWLAAYTHFLSAFAELVLAFEPTDQIARVTDASRQMDLLAGGSEYRNALDMQFGQQVDRVAMIYFALQQQPDAAHTRAAREHLLQMIALNRIFWVRVGAETDNAGEWIPNDSQQQGLGLTVPPGTSARWLAVLDDAEGLLNGTKLIPHWRLRGGAGINLRRMLEDPVPVDLAEWIHGIGLLPFAEEGERVSPDSWLDFEQLMRGNALMFVVFLN